MKKNSAILGAAFLMATSAIGPGFLTQTSLFTEQLLTSFGFVNYEYFINDKLICRIILNPNVSNWVEGNITTKGGSIKNKPINK